MKVSVVVPTYHRPALLKRCLQALIDQDFNPEDYEIIIADDGAGSSTTEAALTTFMKKEGSSRQSGKITSSQLNSLPAYSPVEVVQVGKEAEPCEETVHQETSFTESYRLQAVDPISYSSVTEEADLEKVPGESELCECHIMPAIRYIPVENSRGPAAARNRGWQAAAGEVIAFIDDDCVPSPTWLKNGWERFRRDPSLAGLSGKVLIPFPLNPTDYERNSAELQYAEFVTANSFYRRTVLEEVGGFDERFKVAWREDSDLYFTLLEQNYHLEKSPDSVVLHPIRPAPWGVSVFQQSKAVYNALLYKKHPQLYSQKFIKTPWRYYWILLALAGTLLGLIAHQPVLALTAFLSWTLLTLQFAFLRLQGNSHKPGHMLEMLVTSILIPPLAIYWRLRGSLKYRVLFL